MARRVFFSFEYSDVWRVMQVRNSWVTQGRETAGYIDAAEFEKLKRQGDDAIKRWIDNELLGTSVTVVLVGANTCSSKWVRYEIERSKERGNGLLGIDISKIRERDGSTTACCGQLPAGYDFYYWNNDNGRSKMGAWIEKAAKDAGR